MGLSHADIGAALLQALATEPRAVVWDLTGVDVLDSALSDAFDTLDHYLSGWTGTPVLVCPVNPGLRRTLHAHPLGSRVTTWPHVEDARAAAGRQPRLDRETLELKPIATAPRQARAFVRRTLRRWDAPHLLDEAALVATELVTNAVMHAFTAMTLSVSRPHHDPARTHVPIRLAVRDGDVVIPAVSAYGPLTAGGRGLVLVDTTASSWGVIPLDSGKCVWAVVDDHAVATGLPQDLSG